MEFLKLAEKRYSCKKYSDRMVEEEKLTAILEAGRLAPTAKNLQEQHIYVAADADVDSCWVNCFDPDKQHSLLGLPEDEEILMLLDLGYADAEAAPLPNHFSRKPLTDTVTHI